MSTDSTQNKMFEPPPPPQRRNIYIPYFISLPFGLAMFIMMIVWFSNYQGGYEWNNFALMQQWNWHATLTTLGFSIFLGESILVFRTINNRSRAKVTHVVLHVLGFVLTTVGLSASFSLDTSHLYDNFSSFHTWVGIITYILFIIQFGLGVLTHTISILPRFIRNSHGQCGIALYGLVILSIATGLMLRTSFSQLIIWGGTQTLLANFLGLAFIVFSFFVLYMVIHPQYKK